jgi:hypothetical protein
MRHWGYKSMNGPASLTLAALKKFGLIEDEGVRGDRVAWVSDLAVDILENPSSDRRVQAIKEAALRPAIHRELWDKYGSSLPSDANLRWELTRERGFTETGADEFIPEYKTTIAYAKLTTGDTVSTQTLQGKGEDGDDEPEQDLDLPKPQRRRRVTEDATNVLTIPLAGRAPVTVEGEFPIREEDWTQFMAVLNAMKPGLVRTDSDSGAHDDEQNGW